MQLAPICKTQTQIRRSNRKERSVSVDILAKGLNVPEYLLTVIRFLVYTFCSLASVTCRIPCCLRGGSQGGGGGCLTAHLYQNTKCQGCSDLPGLCIQSGLYGLKCTCQANVYGLVAKQSQMRSLDHQATVLIDHTDILFKQFV